MTILRYTLYGLLFAGTIAAAPLPPPAAQTVPAERPRVRPPSALSGLEDWKKSAEMFQRIPVPPAPPLPPEEAMKTFRIAPGYRLELVAAEPMVQNPISFDFDPQGRIWVVEYQGYQRDVEGHGEGDPICRVVVLEDTDADGRADKSTVFLDKLVMPRSLSFVKGGVLLQEPPNVYFCEDKDGDLRCEKRTVVGQMGLAGNPQHTANGLRYGIDNWLHNSDYTKRHRWVDGRLIEEGAAYRGQFGATFDESGRYFCNYQNSALHADLIPAHYLVRNSHLAQLKARIGGFTGISVNIATKAQEVFPIRVTPLITLGARELRDDGRLRTYTIATGPCYYDADQFPADARGNVFIPEAGGHLIGRLQLSSGILPEATRFYPAEQEFLASTDERFRPVNARVGPDGALYLADMYHGIIEHVIFMVPWISEQVRQRRLDTGNDMGRIYRVVAADRPLNRTAPNLANASTANLVSHLSDAGGWWRLTAQRLLVEQRDAAATPLLKELALHGKHPLGRLHALWTLDGLGALDAETKLAALADANERVACAAIRLCEQGLDAAQQIALISKLTELTHSAPESVKLQSALTIGTLPQAEAFPLLTTLASASHELFAIAVFTGMQGRELEFLRHLMTGAKLATAKPLFILATQCVFIEGKTERVAAMLDLIATAGPAAQRILLGALAALAPKSPAAKPLALPHEPKFLTALTRNSEPAMRQMGYTLMEMFSWPGSAPLAAAGVDMTALTPEQKKRIEAGQTAYTAFCAACHQPSGTGAPNLAPPLAGSDWIVGPPERLARIALHGLYGPVQVNGRTWNLAMPGLGASGLLDDEKLSAILSYIRTAWGNSASAAEPSLVAKVRAETKDRTLPWTSAELGGIAGEKAAAAPVVALKPGDHGEIILPASKANVIARKLAYRPALDVLAPWTIAEDLAEWHVEVPAAGSYEVHVTLAADANSAGDFYVVETQGSRTQAQVPDTGGYEHFKEQPSGQLTLRAGLNRILLRPEGPLKQELADIRRLRLVPVR